MRPERDDAPAPDAFPEGAVCGRDGSCGAPPGERAPVGGAANHGDLLPPADPPATALGRKAEELFGVDLRSLAALRVALALIALLDLALRARWLSDLHGDASVLPRAALQASGLLDPARVSLHLANGSAWFQGLLFLAAAGFALAMLLGWRTRLATAGLFILTASLHAANPLIVNRGDATLRMLLFWGMFVPLGARFSLDAAMDSGGRRLRDRFASMGTAALLAQVALIYWTSALHKTGDAWVSDGSAIYYALHLDQFATGLAVWARDAAPMSLLVALSFGVFWLEALGPFLAFSPIANGWARGVAAALFAALHLGLALFMKLGWFPLVSVAAWIPFLPSGLWDFFAKRTRTPERLGVKVWYDGECAFCLKMARVCRAFLLLPETPILRCQDDASILADMRRLNSWVLEDADGNRRYKFDGAIFLVRQSPIFWPLAPLLRLPFLFAPCTFAYAWVANNRMKAGAAVRWLRYRPLRLGGGVAESLLAGALLGAVYAWCVGPLVAPGGGEPGHIAGGHFAPGQSNVAPRWFAAPMIALHIDQRWDMFAPQPSPRDGWPVFVATLADGRQVDPFRGGAAVDWAKPASVSSLYAGQRWRKLAMTLWRPEYRPLWGPFTAWMRDRWEASHPGANDRVASIEVWMVEETTPPPGEPFAPPIRRLLAKGETGPDGTAVEAGAPGLASGASTAPPRSPRPPDRGPSP